MAANRFLGLPPITPELKSTAPYLQRAHELRTQDPVMAYWCAYYAAQLGISLKAKDNPSRDVLFNLLGVLERMKKEIGANDAIDMEAASSAYVENFALGVFANADNEDRAGNGNRSTAKKFLAAANFLEVLKTFPKSEVAESNEEKIRYARWKAADIAKAFREGRKPASGPAGQPQELSLTPPASPPPPFDNVRHPSPPSSSSRSPPQTKRASPPAHIDITRASPPRKTQPQPQTPPRSTTHLDVDVQGHAHLGSWGGEGEATPGSWSTAATPGTGQPFVNWEQVSPTSATNGGEKSKRGHKPRSGSLSSTETARSGGSGGTSKKKAWVSEELDPQATNQHYPSQRNGTALDSAESGSDGSKKSVRFTPSVAGGLSSDGGLSPIQDEPGYTSVAANWPANLSTSVGYGLVSADELPHGFVPDHPSHSEEWAADLHPSTHITPPSPPQQSSNVYHSPPQPQLYHIPAPQPVYAQHVPTLQASAPPAPAELELSPSIIAKAQKHCRFAISALDYEDAAQAKKELRAALAALGG